MKKRKAKTPKEKAFLKEYANTLNATEAAMRVYNCKDRKSAASIGEQNLRKLEISDALEAEGVSDHYLAKKIKEGAEATKVISARIIVKKGAPTSMANGELPLADERTDDFIEVPDYGVRHKYVETGLRVKGYGPSDKIINIDARTLYVVNAPARNHLDSASEASGSSKKA